MAQPVQISFSTFLNYLSVFALLGVIITSFILHRMKKKSRD